MVFLPFQQSQHIGFQTNGRGFQTHSNECADDTPRLLEVTFALFVQSVLYYLIKYFRPLSATLQPRNFCKVQFTPRGTPILDHTGCAAQQVVLLR